MPRILTLEGIRLHGTQPTSDEKSGTTKTTNKLSPFMFTAIGAFLLYFLLIKKR